MALLMLRLVQVLGLFISSCQALPQRKLSSTQVRWRGQAAKVQRRAQPSSFLQRNAHHMARRVSRRASSNRASASIARRQASIAREARLEGQRQQQQARQQRRNFNTASFTERKKQQLDSLMNWLTVRVCGRHCKIDVKAFDNVKNQCKSDCVASLKLQREASAAVRARGEQPIRFPDASNANMGLHSSNDKTDYNAMMFAGGINHHGNTTFVARLCTHNCHVGDPFFDSTLILGELEQRDASSKEGSALHWKHAAEHWVPHDDGQMAEGDYVGPEDPRMDIVQDARFVTVGMNVPRQKIGCPLNSKVGIHHLFFVPVDKRDNLRTCELHISRTDRCGVQKNWASLVPGGSKDVYYVYSVKPLQVMRLRPHDCETTWDTLPAKVWKSPTDVQFDAAWKVHGGTRYVSGGRVADGELFWSVGHTPPPAYRPVLIGLLMNNATSATTPHFELVGVSCPFEISETFTDPKQPGDEGWEKFWLITTSIVDFDPKADTSTVTFQVYDRENYRTQLHGAGSWLKTVYTEYKKNGFEFQCDQLH